MGYFHFYYSFCHKLILNVNIESRIKLLVVNYRYVYFSPRPLLLRSDVYFSV